VIQASSSVQSAPPGRRVFFIANGTCSDNVGGGDIHFFHMAQAAIDAGHPVQLLGGTALKNHLTPRGLAERMILTDDRKLPRVDLTRFKGQVLLFGDYLARYRRTLGQLDRIGLDDCVYAVTDYWFDALPAIRSRARRKIMILGMDCPSLGEILTQGRPDVTGTRLSSLYYWISQNLSLRKFQRCPHKRLLYVHPAMKPRLLRLGYREDELTFISNGLDVACADGIPPQEIIYDAVWIGRVHTQKGIDDLVATLSHLAKNVEHFRALIIGKVKEQLAPIIEAAGIAPHVHFTGFVSEAEKFRLFKSSRLFLMPSHYESWGIVIGEALACGTPVIAYDLDAYRPVFGDFVHYVPCFDLNGFRIESDRLIRGLRNGENYLAGKNLTEFKRRNSWTMAESIFCSAIEALK
jgi:glycosyltransferase involved in cell wall biosynthesis